MPEPGAGEALLKLSHAALNPADRYMVQGQYPRPAPRPFSVGRDGAGVVAQAAPGGRFKEGDAVIVLRSDLGVSRTGTLAEYVAVPEEALAPLPAGWSMAEGAAGPLVHLTAWMALKLRGGVEAGETVLITGASGGVGSAAIVQAKALGARVVALSGSPEKWPTLESLGADAVVDSRGDDMEERVKSSLEGGRVDLVVENLGGPFLQRCVNLAGVNGRICVIGLLAGLKAELTVGLLIFKCIRIEGMNVGAYTEAASQEAWRDIVGVLDGAGQRPLIDSVYGFDDVQAAFGQLATGPVGKVVIALDSA